MKRTHDGHLGPNGGAEVAGEAAAGPSVEDDNNAGLAVQKKARTDEPTTAQPTDSPAPKEKEEEEEEEDGTVDVADEEAIVNALQAKPNWKSKVADPVLARRYAEEAAKQGASQATIASALRRLLTLAMGTTQSTLYVPKGGDEFDWDFHIDEDEEDQWQTVHVSKVKPPTKKVVPLEEKKKKKDEDEDDEDKDKDEKEDEDEEDEEEDEDEEDEGNWVNKHQVSEVTYVDGLVPDELRKRIEAQLDAIADAPEKDWHPGSDGKVQDLIHPSLYPYIRGISYDPHEPEKKQKKQKKTKKEAKKDRKFQEDDDSDDDDDDADDKPAKDDEEVEGKEEKDDEDDDGDDDDDEEEEDDEDEDYVSLREFGGDAEREQQYRQLEKEIEGADSIYQWLPAEFDVLPDGQVRIVSYINNLDRAKHGALYDDIANVFRLFVPLFNDLLYGSGFFALQNLYGRRVQVVVKAANYVLQPGQDYEGTWHVEGMKHEHILASGIYYYATSDNISDMGLAFRTKRDNSFHSRERTHGLSFNVNLGKVDTPEGRCVAFTNDMQHKVKLLNNAGDSVGVRKILCFFLVDPDIRIKSSADIAPQQWDATKRVVTKTLIGATLRAGVRLPPELIDHVVNLAKWGLTKEEALKHREALMKERKYYVDANNRLYERSFSFCEH